MPPSKVPEKEWVALSGTEPVLAGMVVAEAEASGISDAADSAATVATAYQTFRGIRMDVVPRFVRRAGPAPHAAAVTHGVRARAGRGSVRAEDGRRSLPKYSRNIDANNCLAS
jgi:hypothetical protein